MFDNFLYFSGISVNISNILKERQLTSDNFILCTVHRDHNTDDATKMRALFATLIEAGRMTGLKVVLPLHPRTASVLERNLGSELFNLVQKGDHIEVLPPVSFFDMIELERHCRLVMTDSGGVQKEAYFFGKPVVILRNETEWVEIVESGAGRICGTDTTAILNAVQHFVDHKPQNFSPIFGNGRASDFICRQILENSKQ